MSLYPVSNYNAGLGFSSSTFDVIATSEIDDTTGSPVFTLNSGVATAINTILGCISQVLATPSSSSIAYPVAFLSGSSGKISVYTGSLTYNPLTNVLSGATFTGSATTILTSLVSSGSFYLPLVSATSGVQAIDVSSTLTYNTATSSLITTNFSGLASQASTITIITAIAPQDIFPIVLCPTTGTSQQLSSSTLTYQISSGTINATFFNGTANYVYVSGVFFPQQNYFTFSTSYATSSNNGLWVDPAIWWDNSGHILHCANLAGLATQASAITISSSIASSSYYIPLSLNVSGTNQTIYGDTGLTYNNSGGIGTLIVSHLTGLASSSSTITTTTATGSTYYLTMALSGTGTTSQTIYVDSGLFYNSSTNALTGTTFVGALTGAASQINVGSTSSGVLYFALLNSSTTNPNVVYSTPGIHFNASTGALTATSFLGTASSISSILSSASTGLPILFGSSGSGSIIVETDSSGYLTYNNSTSMLQTENITILADYFQNDLSSLGTYSQIVNNGTIQQNFAGIQQALLQTLSSAAININTGINYIIGAGDCNGTPGTGPVSLALCDVAGAQWALTTSGYQLSFLNDNFPNFGFGWGEIFSMSNVGQFNFYTNSDVSYPLDIPMLYGDNNIFTYSAGIPNSLPSTYISISPTILFDINTITFQVNGNNPFNRSITFSFNVGFNFTITAISGASFPTTQTIKLNATAVNSATLNGSSFSGYSIVYSSGFGTTYNYFQTHISKYNIFQPVGQASFTFTPTNTGNTNDTYVFIFTPSYTASTITNVSLSLGVLGINYILVDNSITASFALVSGTAGITTTTTPTTSLLSISRSIGTNTPTSGITLNAWGANIGDTNRYEGIGGFHVGLGVLNSATAVGQNNSIQLGTANGTNQSWFIAASNQTTTATTFSLAPYNGPFVWIVDGVGHTTQTGQATAQQFTPTTHIYGSTSSYHVNGDIVAFVAGVYKYKIFMSVSALATGGVAYVYLSGLPTTWYQTYSATVSVNGISTVFFNQLVPTINYVAISANLGVALTNYSTTTVTNTMTVIINFIPD